VKIIEKIQENIILQAKHYLSEFESFYPFACVIDNRNNIKPVSAYLENDSPDVEEVLSELILGLKKGIEKKEYKAVGIALDVSVTPPHKKDTLDAIEIRVWDNGSKVNIYVPYFRETNGDISFIDSYREEGTFG
jgi:hypothetical protein